MTIFISQVLRWLLARGYETWVRKEAYVKALGKGLSISLKAFSVPLESEAPVSLRPDGNPWRFHSLTVSPNYAAALATPHPATSIHSYHWRPLAEA